MATVCFEKAILTSPYIVKGKAVAFDALAGNHGVLCLNSETDKELISALNEAITKGIGGIGRITEERANELKKNRPWQPPAPKSWLDEPLKINGKKLKPPTPPGKKADAAVVSPVSAPVEKEVPQGPPDQPDFKTSPGIFKPATRKLGKLEVASDV